MTDLKDISYHSETYGNRVHVRAVHAPSGIEGEATDFSSYHKAKTRALADLFARIRAAEDAARPPSTPGELPGEG